MPNSHPFITAVNSLLEKLDSNNTLDAGIDIANEILKLLGTFTAKPVEDIYLEQTLSLPNAERYDSWFQPHPIFKSDRACFDLTDADLFQAKFYWLKKHSRQIIAGGVHFTPNFEDEDFTHNERYKVGVDFFLSPNGKSLQVALSNRGNLRIVELNKRLNSTQVDIFTKWEGAGNLSTQEALHTTLWDSFKLKSVNQKFYDGVANSFNELLQHLKSINKDDEEAKLFASRLLGRLLFCWFLRKKGIIDESVGYFNAKGHGSTHYYRSSLEKLFFLTLNTPIDERDELQKQHQKQLFANPVDEQQPSLFKTDQKTPYLNGGLFEPHENDWFKDDSLTFPEGFFVNLFEHFEQFNFTTDESSPEYELIAIDPEMLGRVFESLLATQVDSTGQQARKAKGAFYTPREIVSYMCKESLRNYLYGAVGEGDDTKASIDSLLDISDSQWARSKSNTLRDKIKDYRQKIVDALDNVTVLDPACGSGAFPMGMLQLMIRTYERLESRFDPYKTKLQIIQNNIFGVDIEPMAVEIARLRAWLSLIVDEENSRSVEPLPNLDFKFVCANSLIPLNKELGLFSDNQLHQKLKDVRAKYFNARKPGSKKTIQNEYYALTNNRQTLIVNDDTRTIQLKSFDPFKNSRPAEFFDTEQMFGLANGFDLVIGNPPYIQLSKKGVTADYKKLLIETYGSSMGRLNTFGFFTRLGIKLLKDDGVQSFIIPNTILTQEYYEQLRKYLLDFTQILQIVDIEALPFESAVVENVIIFNKKATKDKTIKIVSSDGLLFTHRENKSQKDFRKEVNHNFNIRSKSNDSSMLDKIFKDSTKLGEIAHVNQGVALKGSRELWVHKDNPDGAYKKVVRGRDINKYHLKWNGLYLNYTPAAIHSSKNPLIYHAKGKIMFRRVANRLIATYDAESYYGLNTIVVITVKPKYIVDFPSKYILAIFNSKLFTYIYNSRFSSTKTVFSEIGAKKVMELPLKNTVDDIKYKIIVNVNKLLELGAREPYDVKNPTPEQSKLDKEIDQLIYQIYGLSREEIDTIEDSLK